MKNIAKKIKKGKHEKEKNKMVSVTLYKLMRTSSFVFQIPHLMY